MSDIANFFSKEQDLQQRPSPPLLALVKNRNDILSNGLVGLGRAFKGMPPVFGITQAAAPHAAGGAALGAIVEAPSIGVDNTYVDQTPARVGTPVDVYKDESPGTPVSYINQIASNAAHMAQAREQVDESYPEAA